MRPPNEELKKRKRQKSKTCSTRPSRVVPHRSTTRARPCLTSLFGWEAVTQGDMAACERDEKNSSHILYSFSIHTRTCSGTRDARGRPRRCDGTWRDGGRGRGRQAALDVFNRLIILRVADMDPGKKKTTRDLGMEGCGEVLRRKRRGERGGVAGDGWGWLGMAGDGWGWLGTAGSAGDRWGRWGLCQGWRGSPVAVGHL